MPPVPVKKTPICPFAKALLNGQSGCCHAESFHIAERHGIHCTQKGGQQQCKTFSDQLHQQSRFALGITQLPQQMTSNMELRIQCGGINGLQHALGKETSSTDIHQLVTEASSRFGGIAEIPYPEVIQSISRWSPRKRGRNRGQTQPNGKLS